MAISKAFKVAAQSGSSATTLTTGTFDSTGYTHMVVAVKHEGTATTITPSDNKSSGTFNALTKKDHSNGDLHGQLFWVPIGTPGTGHTVTVTLGAARAFRTVIVWAVNVNSGTMALDAETEAQDAGVSTAVDAGTLSTSGVSVVSFMLVCEYNTVSWTPGSGWTEDYDPGGPANYTYGESRGPETTSPIDPTATASANTNWVACAASFKESGGGGGGPTVKALAALGVG